MKQSVLRGTIYLMAAQAAFVASGYAIHIGLARLLGPSEYGIYAVVISLMTMVNLILTTGIPQAVFILALVLAGYAVFEILMKPRCNHNNYQNTSTS
ncbi:MAG: oligosaccharide flippase family protein [Euryarchaeota archaeon]|nr:oligosaccharide flippase family protein [Euryarchaeota archaeon]